MYAGRSKMRAGRRTRRDRVADLSNAIVEELDRVALGEKDIGWLEPSVKHTHVVGRGKTVEDAREDGERAFDLHRRLGRCKRACSSGEARALVPPPRRVEFLAVQGLHHQEDVAAA